MLQYGKSSWAEGRARGFVNGCGTGRVLYQIITKPVCFLIWMKYETGLCSCRHPLRSSVHLDLAIG